MMIQDLVAKDKSTGLSMGEGLTGKGQQVCMVKAKQWAEEEMRGISITPGNGNDMQLSSWRTTVHSNYLNTILQ